MKVGTFRKPTRPAGWLDAAVMRGLDADFLQPLVVEAVVVGAEPAAQQVEVVRDHRVPAVEQVELDSDPVGAVPALLLGELLVQAEPQGQAGEVVDVLLDHQLQSLDDVDVARGLEQPVVVPGRVRRRQHPADAVVLADEDGVQGGIEYRVAAALQPGGVEPALAPLQLLRRHAAVLEHHGQHAIDDPLPRFAAGVGEARELRP
jgi:hypothetical protein